MYRLVPPYALRLVGTALCEMHLRKRPTKPGYFTNLSLTGENFEIGDYTYGMPRVFFAGSQGTRLKIGKFCSISDEVIIFLGGNHRTDWVSTYPFISFPDEWPEAKDIPGHPASKGGVIIGNDVWIGYGATIMSGVTIGDGAAIGARALVASDVEPYSIVAGNPAYLVRKRFNEETIQMLLETRWWDWPIDKIKTNMGVILSTDIPKILQL
jgi:acetyltransferase-like isoleucine patch superfamily enzyme